MNSTADRSPYCARFALHERDSCSGLETMDAAATSESRLAVGLIVGAGTHAGVTAEIREGIYMIGRHRECQIRPKSQSVSERHCLVQHRSSTVGVFDLESEEGTFVNDVQVEPKKWKLLNHGDRLRCGRYWFDLAIYLRDANEPESLSGSADEILGRDEDAPRVASVELFDDADFVMNHDSPLSRAAGEQECNQTAAKSPRLGTVRSAGKSRPLRLPKPKIGRAYSTSSRRSLATMGSDSWQTLGAILAMVLICGYLGWSVYQMQKGSPAKIVQGVD